MVDRLKWMKQGDGFVAYPEGPAFTSRRAEIRYQLTMPVGNRWQWVVAYDGASHHGWTADRQAASNEANLMWPGVREEAKAVAAEKRAKEELQALVDRQALIGDVPIEDFAIATSSSDRLRSLIAASTIHFSRHAIPTYLAPLMAACSAELYRRRTSQ